MNQQDWISEWIEQARTAVFDPTFVDRVMTATTASAQRRSFVRSFVSSLSERVFRRIQSFSSKPLSIASGAFGGFARIAIFVYVLLFVS